MLHCSKEKTSQAHATNTSTAGKLHDNGLLMARKDMAIVFKTGDRRNEEKENLNQVKIRHLYITNGHNVAMHKLTTL